MSCRERLFTYTPFEEAVVYNPVEKDFVAELNSEQGRNGETSRGGEHRILEGIQAKSHVSQEWQYPKFQIRGSRCHTGGRYLRGTTMCAGSVRWRKVRLTTPVIKPETTCIIVGPIGPYHVLPHC